MSDDLRAQLRVHACRFGFDDIGITDTDSLGASGVRLQTWLAGGNHGDMDWMGRHATRRAHPRALWDKAQSVIVVAMNYASTDTPLALARHPECGMISTYARGRDYHDIIKKRLKQLAHWLVEQTGAQVKVFVDTAPLMEKPLAQAAGIGWQGKHTNLVSQQYGSWLFLGVILTDLVLSPDAPMRDQCGSCTACLTACPTNAFTAPYQLDARRCISYLTIEHKGVIDVDLRAALGNHIYGCDDCLAACPWNKYAQMARNQKAFGQIVDDMPSLLALAQLDDTAFRAMFAGSPIKRTGRDRFVRNVLIAIGNGSGMGEAHMQEVIVVLKARLLDRATIVRAMAVWGLRQWCDDADFAALAAVHQPRETERDVMDEWVRELACG